MVQELSDAKFEEEVLKSDKPVVVDFWAPWCGPCKILGPTFEKVAGQVKDAKFFKMNVDENQQSPQQFGVMGIPCVIIFKNGEEVDRVVGAVPEDKLKSAIEAAL